PQRAASGMTSSSFANVSAMTPQNGVSDASGDRYSRVAIVLHWAIAAFIIFNLCSGFCMKSWLHGALMESAPPQMRWLSLVLHVSSGLTVLALTVARVVWRLLNAPPANRAEMRPRE